MSQSMIDRALGRLSTRGILIYVTEDESAEVEIPTDYYYKYYDIFVKKGNKAWRYGLGSPTRFSGRDHLHPDLEIPLSDLTKIMLWENTQIINITT